MSSDTSGNQNPEQGASTPSQYPGYPPFPYKAPVDDEIDLRELWGAVWQGKWIIIATTVIFAVAAVTYALSLPNIYQSKTLLAPSEDAQGGGMSKMAGQLGGLASLAGITMGATGDNKVAVAMEVLKSRKFVTGFIAKHNVLPELMAVEHWNRAEDKLIFDEDIYDSAQKQWVREVDPPKVPEPSPWEAYKEFMKILTVSQDKETGFVSVALEHQSPSVAEAWVTLLVKDVNSVMKEKDVEEAERSVEFLQEQLSKVALADMRTVFYQLIEEQTKTIMLAQVRDEYVFSTIDPPVAAEEKVKPKRALILIMGIILGGMLAVMFVLVRHFASVKRRR